MDQKKTCHRFYSMCLTCCMCGGFFCGQLDPVQQAKHSSSAVEVTACFSQVREIWLQLAWPDSAGAFIFITRLTDVSPTRKKIHEHTGRHVFFLTNVTVKTKKGKREDEFNNTTGVLSVKEFLQRGCLLLGDDNTQD